MNSWREVVMGTEDCAVLSEADLDEIERLAALNESETYRGPLLALVAEVRRLRSVILAPGSQRGSKGPSRG
jgi:hypothetical protein